MVLDLLSWLCGRATPEESGEIERRAVELANRVQSDTVSPEVLGKSGERAADPLVIYLEEGEQPEYVLSGGQLLISDEDGSLATKYPTRELQVVVTGARLLFVLGGRFSDSLWEISYDDADDAYLDDAEAVRRYIVVETAREGASMTFFADVTTMPETVLEESVDFIGRQL